MKSQVFSVQNNYHFGDFSHALRHCLSLFQVKPYSAQDCVLKDQQRSLNQVTKRVENCWYYHKIINLMMHFFYRFYIHDSMIFQILFLVSRPNPRAPSSAVLRCGCQRRRTTRPQRQRHHRARRSGAAQQRGARRRVTETEGQGRQQKSCTGGFHGWSWCGVGAQGLGMVKKNTILGDFT